MEQKCEILRRKYEISDVFRGRNIEAKVRILAAFPVGYMYEILGKSAKYLGESTYLHWAYVFGAKVRNIEFAEKQKAIGISMDLGTNMFRLPRFPLPPQKYLSGETLRTKPETKGNLLSPPLRRALLKS